MDQTTIQEALEGIQPALRREAGDTEIGAAAQTSKRLPKRVAVIFGELGRSGGVGRTDHELQRILRISGNSERPARIALVDVGLVEDSGDRRPTSTGALAKVWRLTTKGWDLYTMEPRQ